LAARSPRVKARLAAHAAIVMASATIIAAFQPECFIMRQVSFAM
jgi:hypothetical protein